MTDTRTQLLDHAEAAMRTKGYHAVSFRNLADDLGIKSASVHYHFRKKEDLGRALIQRYSEVFFDTLNAESGPPAQAICATYRAALLSSDALCLCGILGAESTGLPEAMSAAVAAFFQDNIDWLAQCLNDRTQATHIVATLQGAMMLATSLQDPDVFDAATQSLNS